jgi:hypothetical protein
MNTSNESNPVAGATGSEFVEYEGKVHLINPLMGREFTMCGDAFDAHSSENAPEREFKSTRKRTVTCEQCAAVIIECRGVRVKTLAA